jgi:hypothetical protein
LSALAEIIEILKAHLFHRRPQDDVRRRQLRVTSDQTLSGYNFAKRDGRVRGRRKKQRGFGAVLRWKHLAYAECDGAGADRRDYDE